jgi:hypothetical protein
MFIVLLAEFSVLIIFIQFFGIDFFTMLNSAIQLDLNFSLKYHKHILNHFYPIFKNNRFINKNNVLVPPNNLFSDIYECDR